MLSDLLEIVEGYLSLTFANFLPLIIELNT